MRQTFNATVIAELDASEPLTREQEAVATPWELVQANLRYASTVVVEYANYADLNELYSVAKEGLIEASKRFKPEMGNKFISYATWWIRQSILLHLKTIHLIRIPQSVIQNMSNIDRYYEHDEDAIEEGTMTVNQVARVKEARYLMRSLSLDFMATDSRATYHEAVPDERPEVLDTLLEEDLKGAVSRYMTTTLNPKEQDVVTRYFGLDGNDPHTLEEISLTYDQTRERMRQIKEKALTKMRHPKGPEKQEMLQELV